MADAPITIGQLAEEVRSKNAGPFWITLDIFLDSDQDYQALITSGVLTAARIGNAYQVEPAGVEIFSLAALRAIKISFPRAVTAGSFYDRDQHAGQQHIPLANLVLRASPQDDEDADADHDRAQHEARL